MDGPSADRAFTALLMILILAWLSCRSLSTGPNAGAVSVADAMSVDTTTERMVGTVKAFDPRTNVLTLITGVGHALRVVRITVPPTVAVRGAGTYPPELVPGCIVRVELEHAGAARTAAPARVASSVTVLRLPVRGRTP